MVKVELASSVEEEASSLIPFLSWLDICCLPPRYPYSPFSAVRPLGFHQQAWFSTWGQFRVGKWPKPADQNLNTFLILLGQWCLLFLTIWLFQLFEQLQRRTLLPYGLRFSSRVYKINQKQTDEQKKRHTPLFDIKNVALCKGTS